MPDRGEKELYISVDVETAGPNPSQYALLSIGACTVDERRRTFYVELKPGDIRSTSEAQATHNLDLEALQASGLPPQEAMAAFEEWVNEVTPPGVKPIFVGFNAAFDWMFVADTFHRTLGRNPFGHSALDIKALYMGMSGSTWAQTTKRTLSPRYLDGRHLSHNALSDALDQAEIFEKILEEIREAHKSKRD